MISKDTTVFVYCGDDHAQNRLIYLARIVESVHPGKTWSAVQLDSSYQAPYDEYGKLVNRIRLDPRLAERTFGFLGGVEHGVGAHGVIYHAGNTKDKSTFESSRTKALREAAQREPK
jgi:hypothetical protein